MINMQNSMMFYANWQAKKFSLRICCVCMFLSPVVYAADNDQPTSNSPIMVSTETNNMVMPTTTVASPATVPPGNFANLFHSSNPNAALGNQPPSRGMTIPITQSGINPNKPLARMAKQPGNTFATPTNQLPPGAVDQKIKKEKAEYGQSDDPSFQDFLKRTFPLSPQQMSDLRDLYVLAQKNMAIKPGNPPKPTFRMLPVSLSPDTTPPVLRLATGYVSAVIFTDETGKPWPVTGFDIGDPSNFNIQWQNKSHIMYIQGNKPFTSGNMIVQLEGLLTPLILTITVQQDVVDYRVDLRVHGRGPYAVSGFNQAVDANTNPILLSLLQGIPPAQSIPILIKGGDAQAWKLNGILYLRTPMTLISPGWQSMMTSADGTNAYQLNLVPSVLVSEHGQTTTLKMENI